MEINIYHTCVKSKTKEPQIIAKPNEDKKKWKNNIFDKKGINLLNYYEGENIKHFNNIETLLLEKGVKVNRFIICWATGIQEKSKKIKPYSLENINKKEREALFFYLNNHNFDEKTLNIFFLKPEDIKTLLPILPKNKIIITSETKLSKKIKEIEKNIILYDIEKAKVLVKEGGPILISKYPYYLLSKCTKEINFKNLNNLSKELLDKVIKRKKITDLELKEIIKKEIKNYKTKNKLINFIREEKNISLFIDRFNKVYNEIKNSN